MPLSWNRYAYGLSDPINLKDPSGLAASTADCLAAAGGKAFDCVQSSIATYGLDVGQAKYNLFSCDSQASGEWSRCQTEVSQRCDGEMQCMLDGWTRCDSLQRDAKQKCQNAYEDQPRAADSKQQRAADKCWDDYREECRQCLSSPPDVIGAPPTIGLPRPPRPIGQNPGTPTISKLALYAGHKDSELIGIQ